MTNIEGARILVGRDLEGSSAYLHSKASEIMDHLNGLKTQLQTLIDAWQARSSFEYQNRMQDWDDAAMALFGPGADGVLGQIAVAMNVNWDNYYGTEEANYNMFRKV